MPHSGHYCETLTRKTVPFLDIFLIACLSAAIVCLTAQWSSSKGQAVSLATPQADKYHPVETQTVTLRGRTVLAPVEVAPAQPIHAAPPVRQLPNSGPGFLMNFTDDPLQENFWASQSNGIDNFYGGRWAPENVQATYKGIELAVHKENAPNSPYSMSEVRSKEPLGYGRYEAVMQIGKGSGLVSAFFTYTGPYEGQPHDEVDIEFVGRDTTKVEFNYWRNGKSGDHATFDLPFDASAEPHLYAFEWLPDRITWFIDGKPYYSTKPDDTHIPSHPGRMYFSHWTGIPAMEAWHGKPDFKSGEATIVQCASFTPVNEDAPSCSDEFDPAGKAPAAIIAFLTLSP